MNNKTKDYLARLNAGTREQVDRESNIFAGEQVIPPQWVDVALLCDVLDEIINKTNAHIKITSLKIVVWWITFNETTEGGYYEN